MTIVSDKDLPFWKALFVGLTLLDGIPDKVGILLTHLPRAALFQGSPQGCKDGTICSIPAKGVSILASPFKAFAERAATE